MQDTPPQPLDEATAEAIDAVYHLYDPPLWLVTAARSPAPGDRRAGCIATFVARASIVKRLPRMLTGIARHHHTWHVIEASGRFAVHLLPETAVDQVWRFALRSGHEVDKFAGLPDVRTPDGNPLIESALSWLDCRVETSIDTGDRSLYLAAVTGGGRMNADAGPPLTAERLMALSPPETRNTLDRLYIRDGGIDAQAIEAWRLRQPKQ